MRRWWNRNRADKNLNPRGVEVQAHMKPVRLSQALKGLGGKWVALKNGAPIDASPTPDELYTRLHEKGIRGATILRVPVEDEPEIVGFA